MNTQNWRLRRDGRLAPPRSSIGATLRGALREMSLAVGVTTRFAALVGTVEREDLVGAQVTLYDCGHSNDDVALRGFCGACGVPAQPVLVVHALGRSEVGLAACDLFAGGVFVGDLAVEDSNDDEPHRALRPFDDLFDPDGGVEAYIEAEADDRADYAECVVAVADELGAAAEVLVEALEAPTRHRIDLVQRRLLRALRIVTAAAEAMPASSAEVA